MVQADCENDHSVTRTSLFGYIPQCAHERLPQLSPIPNWRSLGAGDPGKCSHTCKINRISNDISPLIAQATLCSSAQQIFIPIPSWHYDIILRVFRPLSDTGTDCTQQLLVLLRRQEGGNMDWVKSDYSSFPFVILPQKSILDLIPKMMAQMEQATLGISTSY